ncbi:MAG: hypothetical protein PHR35_17180 [Kiritimatiellae bacterium]|nr:hypothetical protein [Kiritimatiellia bacterium]
MAKRRLAAIGVVLASLCGCRPNSDTTHPTHRHVDNASEHQTMQTAYILINSGMVAQARVLIRERGQDETLVRAIEYYLDKGDVSNALRFVDGSIRLIHVSEDAYDHPDRHVDNASELQTMQTAYILINSGMVAQARVLIREKGQDETLVRAIEHYLDKGDVSSALRFVDGRIRLIHVSEDANAHLGGGGGGAENSK